MTFRDFLWVLAVAVVAVAVGCVLGWAWIMAPLGRP